MMVKRLGEMGGYDWGMCMWLIGTMSEGPGKGLGEAGVEKRRTDLRKLPYGCLFLSPAPHSSSLHLRPTEPAISGCVKAQSCQGLNILLETQEEKYSLHGETT